VTFQLEPLPTLTTFCSRAEGKHQSKHLNKGMGISWWFPLDPIWFGNVFPAPPSVISLFMLARSGRQTQILFCCTPHIPVVPFSWFQALFCYENCQQLGNTYLARTKANTAIQMQRVDADRWHILTAARRSAHLGYAHSIYIYIEKSPLPTRPALPI